MRSRKHRILALLAISSCLAAIMLLDGAQSAHATVLAAAGTPTPEADPTPLPTPTPGPTETEEDTSDGGGAVTTVNNIFHHLVFPADTIALALNSIFVSMAEDQARVLQDQYAMWSRVIGDIILPPTPGRFAEMAEGSWPVAAILAPVLFILRIAIYNWNRLTGEDDSAGQAAGDILTSLVLAVLCGWFLDLVARLGWTMTAATMGDAAALAKTFVDTMSPGAALGDILAAGMLGGLLGLAIQLGAILAVAGMLLAFASAEAGLFLLATLGPSIAVASAIPQVRWLRALWIKAVTIIAVLPLVAGAIFASAAALGAKFYTGGIIDLFIRLLWLWGATGAMLSLAGILGKLTITTAVDAVGKVVKAGASVAATAALAGAGAGVAAGAGAGAGAGVAAEAGAGGGLAAAQSHLGTAKTLSAAGGWLDAAGLHGPAAFARSLSGSHGLAARQAELSSRMDDFVKKKDEETFDDVGFGVTKDARRDLLDGYGGGPKSVSRAYQGLSSAMEGRGFSAVTLQELGRNHPYEVGKMLRTFASEQESVGKEDDPLREVAKRAGYDLDQFFPDGQRQESGRQS